MQSNNQQFFKVIPSSSLINSPNKPVLGNYNSILQTLKNKNFLYVDFNKNDHDSLALLQKTNSPLKNHHQDQDDDDNGAQDFKALGNQFISDMNNLSLHSYKMMRYVSEGKKIMRKKKNVDEIQTSFINEIKSKGTDENNKINFGPNYRRIQQRNKRLQYSSKIQPQKLEQYLQNKNYRKVERRLLRSERQLGLHVTNVREMRQNSLQLCRMLQKASFRQEQQQLSKELLTERKRLERGCSLAGCESENLKRASVSISNTIRFPRIKILSKQLAQCFTSR